MPAALKAGQRVRLSALRMLSAAVTNREVEVGHPLTDEEFVDVATREVKRRNEAIEAFAAAGREDRAATEREEREALEAYLPAPLSEGEVDALVEEAIASTGADGPAGFGKVMSYVMGRARGRVDGKAVRAKVRSRLEPGGG
ncbi:MAG: GatB/YqeY domain-containing protein [Actinobacteria bacterium]|nr:MAG: GatB/YqeY domain-containing protein [Actinomycetota bacterium]